MAMQSAPITQKHIEDPRRVEVWVILRILNGDTPLVHRYTVLGKAYSTQEELEQALSVISEADPDAQYEGQSLILSV